MKIAFQQPLVPVLPVARELIAKTKWVHTKNNHADSPKRIATPKQNGATHKESILPKRLRTFSMKPQRANTITPSVAPPMPSRGENDLSALGLVSEPLPLDEDESSPEERRPGRRNILKVFAKRHRSKSRARGSFESGSSVSVSLFPRAIPSSIANLLASVFQMQEPAMPRSSQQDPPRILDETASA